MKTPIEPHESAAVDRRGFLQLALAAGVAAALPGAVDAFAQATPAATKPVAAADSIARAAVPAAPSEDAIALASVLRRRFPGRLDEKQWKDVTEELDARLASGKRLAELKLANGVDPDFTFRA